MGKQSDSCRDVFRSRKVLEDGSCVCQCQSTMPFAGGDLQLPQESAYSNVRADTLVCEHTQPYKEGGIYRKSDSVPSSCQTDHSLHCPDMDGKGK